MYLIATDLLESIYNMPSYVEHYGNYYRKNDLMIMSHISFPKYWATPIIPQSHHLLFLSAKYSIDLLFWTIAFSNHFAYSFLPTYLSTCHYIRYSMYG